MTDKFNASDCTEFGRSAIERADPRRPVRLRTCALQALRILLPNEVPSDAIRLVAIRVRGENMWFRPTPREDITTLARHLGIMRADDRRHVYDFGDVEEPEPGMARDERVQLDGTPPTLKQWLASHSKGAFLVHVRSHVFPVVDGVVKDWNIYGDGADAGVRRRVLAFVPCTGASVGTYIRPKREAEKHNANLARRKEERARR